MIVYQATKTEFLDQVHTSDIELIVEDAFVKTVGHTVSKSEIRSWKESLGEMATVLTDKGIPDSTGVAIEFNIPQTGKRVDFILTGKDELEKPKVIIVELKQWTSAELSPKDGVVVSFVGGAKREVIHPAYQAWAYSALLEGFNEEIYDRSIKLQPCAYLHNYKEDDVIRHPQYAFYIDKAPVFLEGADEREKLRNFIKLHVKHGDDLNLLYEIDHGRIRPSKMLADSLVGMMKGQREFVLIDDQKLVHETAMALARKASGTQKKVLIVRGGPGTGKSVVAINLLAGLSKVGQNCRYVSKNSAPRVVYQSRLSGSFRPTVITNFFSSSGAFIHTAPESFDTLIVDEAHRLNEKSGLFGNLGENQVKEIIRAANCSVFFIDEDQRVTLKDIGTKSVIAQFAAEAGAELVEAELASQFRCSGSDGYLAWLDNTLGVRKTANERLGTNEFDFRVFDSPNDLHEAIKERNNVNNKARVVAGYCWEWKSKKSPSAVDVTVPAHGYGKQWNLDKDGSLWIVAPNSVDEVGCIHTCQGLEVDYIGVIVGEDFVVRNETVVCQPEKRAKHDKSIRGWKTLLKSSPQDGQRMLDLVIKNTYRTLMTRGLKGCYIYCTDKETSDYFKSKLASGQDPKALQIPVAKSQDAGSSGVVLPFRRLASHEIQCYKNCLPLLDLKIAAGGFSEFQIPDEAECEWVAFAEMPTLQPGMFVAQVVGESMNKKIPNGAWCLFRSARGGSRTGRIVLAQHRSIHDPETGGSFTVKIYRSEKVLDEDGGWKHSRIELHPASSDASYAAIIFTPEDSGDVRICAEFVKVLG